MADETRAEQTVTRWIEALKASGAYAAQELWQRYFTARVRLARARLCHAVRIAADEEDVALSAFDRFCQGLDAQRDPRMEDRDDLWRRLLVITGCTEPDQAQRERRPKRDGGKIFGMLRRSDVD
jgi:hypothetical protein